MSFCHKCGVKYSSEAGSCPLCQVDPTALKERRAMPAAQSVDDSWIGICRIDDAARSAVVQGALNSSNIPSMIMSSAYHDLAGDDIASIPAAAKAWLGQIVMVPREFQQEAELILEAVLGNDLDITI